jgi:hypothetical protein
MKKELEYLFAALAKNCEAAILAALRRVILHLIFRD